MSVQELKDTINENSQANKRKEVLCYIVENRLKCNIVKRFDFKEAQKRDSEGKEVVPIFNGNYTSYYCFDESVSNDEINDLYQTIKNSRFERFGKSSLDLRMEKMEKHIKAIRIYIAVFFWITLVGAIIAAITSIM